ncbi:MAG: ParB/RepB/Spo0J family partition protein [Coriobacteriia bacterium]|nr:ParB/RepB/Spo0J family partition protein [Coriobacteriia bacterium]
MANKNKGGLGRGLNALLGGSYEEGIPAEPAPQVEEKAEPKPATKAPAAPKPAEKPPVVVQSQEEQHVAEENITIKSVASREARPAKPKETKTEAPKKDSKAVETQPAENKETPVQEQKNNEEVDITLVFPNPNQPRTNFKKEELEELAGSIERDGLLQPILVRTMPNGTYQIIAGERRWQACKQVGLKKVPVRIREASEDEALELALIENIQRSDLNPIEEAYGYKRVMERQGLTQSELAQMLSKGRSTIANALRLLDLPEDAQQLLFEEKITAGHARAILSISSKEGRQKLTEKMVAEKISVREAENIARLLDNRPKTTEGTKRPETPKSFKVVARSLRKKFETNVRVKTVQGKNKIEIEFKDEEELQRIFKNIMNEQEESQEEAQTEA